MAAGGRGPHSGRQSKHQVRRGAPRPDRIRGRREDALDPAAADAGDHQQSGQDADHHQQQRERLADAFAVQQPLDQVAQAGRQHQVERGEQKHGDRHARERTPPAECGIPQQTDAGARQQEQQFRTGGDAQQDFDQK
jgi:hypothetical protein